MSHSESLWWEKIGKVANWVKLAIPSHSEPLWWEKIGNICTHIFTHIYMYVCMYVYIYIYIYICNVPPQKEGSVSQPETSGGK